MGGGKKSTWGAISRMSRWTVSGSSGKLSVKPAMRPQEIDIICSPIHEKGRNDTKSSRSSQGSRASMFCPILSMFRWVTRAPPGRGRRQPRPGPLGPVVADEAHLIAPAKPQRSEPQGQEAHFFQIAAPGGRPAD